ncbi:MAG TPA: hypothetical protein VGE52_20105 [Pirellulales bacterium]
MVKRIQAGMVVTIAVLFALSLSQCREPYDFLDRTRPARWAEYGVMLERRVGPLRHLGGMNLCLGGCDVYQAADATWWLVGPGKRWRQCTPETAIQTSNDLVLEAAIKREAEDAEMRDVEPIKP